MSLLLVDVAIVGGGVLLGRWLVRSMRARAANAAPAGGAGSDVPAKPTDPLAGFPCKLGDVLTRTAEGDEAWLAGALVLEEDKPVAAIFIAPNYGLAFQARGNAKRKIGDERGARADLARAHQLLAK